MPPLYDYVLILIQAKCIPSTTNEKPSEESSNAKLFNATAAGTSNYHNGREWTAKQSALSFGL